MSLKATATLTAVGLKLLLKARDSRAGEGCLYSHAAALYHDNTNQKKKSSIGKSCLHILIDFLVDEANDSGLRRWAGVLLRELCEGNVDNIERLALYSEEKRRKLGHLVLHEISELTRLICGQIIRTALVGGADIECFWPSDIDPELYKIFPDPQEGEMKWNVRFSDYVDNIWDKYKHNDDGPEQLYYVQNIRTTPSLDFENEGHNLDLSIGLDRIIFWVAANSGSDRFEQCLEVPLEILTLLTQVMGNSQIKGETVSVKLDFGQSLNNICFLNGVKTSVTSIEVDMKLDDCHTMGAELSKLCPTMKIIQNERQDEDRDSYETQQVSQTTQPKNTVRSGRSKEVIHLGLKSTSVEEVNPTNSAPITSPDAHDASTPKSVKKIPLAKQVKKGQSKYSLRAKVPVFVAKLSPQITAKPNVDGKSNSTAKAGPTKALKKTSTNKSKTHPVDDVYAFPSDDFDEVVTKTKKATRQNKIAAKLTKASTTNEGVKNSIPAVSGQTMRTRRSAAVRASQQLREKASDVSDIEDAAPWTSKAQPSMKLQYISESGQLEVNDKVLTTMKTNRSRDMRTQNLVISDGSSFEETAPQPGLIPKTLPQHAPQDIIAAPEEEDLYSASPIVASKIAADDFAQKSAKDPDDPTAAVVEAKGVSIRQGQGISTGAFALKLGSMLEDLEEPVMDLPQPMHTPRFKALSEQDDKTGAEELVIVTKLPEHIDVEEDSDKENTVMMAGVEAQNLPEQDYPQTPPEMRRDEQDMNMTNAVQPENMFLEQSVGSRKKQKVAPHTKQSAKRHQFLNKVGCQTPQRRSPRLQQKVEKLAYQRNDSPNLPTRVSIRQAVRAKGTAAGNSGLLCTPLIDDHLARKQPIISFGMNGARNQGLPSSVRQSTVTQRPSDTLRVKNMAKSSPAKPKSTQRKRKRVLIGGTSEETGIRPLKRQSVSPNVDEHNGRGGNDLGNTLGDKVNPRKLVVKGSPNLYYNEMGVDNIEHESSSQQQESFAISPIKSLRSQRSRTSKGSRHTSQASRVDENGSPIASRSSQIDHIGKVQRRLLDDLPEPLPIPEAIRAQRPDLPALFGPKAKLGSIPKAQPAEPEDVVNRYVPHKKTITGCYEEITSKEIVAPGKDLADPFVGGRPKAKFDNFLKMKLLQQILDTGAENDMGEEVDESEIVDDGKTLVDDLPSLMTGTTLASKSDETPDLWPANDRPVNMLYERAAVREHWDVGLRPHYASLSDAVHRIADEVVIRMAKEEDVLALLVDQYKGRGSKFLENHHLQRRERKAHIEKEVSRRKSEMLKSYTEAQSALWSAKSRIEKNSVSQFEKQWKKKQDDVRALISKNRRGQA